jgi:hypothetical protein
MLILERVVQNFHHLKPLTSNDLQRHRAVSPLKIKIPSTKVRQAALRGGI